MSLKFCRGFCRNQKATSWGPKNSELIWPEWIQKQKIELPIFCWNSPFPKFASRSASLSMAFFSRRSSAVCCHLRTTPNPGSGWPSKQNINQIWVEISWWLNQPPFGKYANVKMDHFSRVKIKNIWNHHAGNHWFKTLVASWNVCSSL